MTETMIAFNSGSVGKRSMRITDSSGTQTVITEEQIDQLRRNDEKSTDDVALISVFDFLAKSGRTK